MSSTSTTRRSRSGCQVRTTTVRLRALARQSTLRTSSPLDVLPQRVELGALAAHPHRGPAVELAQPGEPAGQVLACDGNGRQHPQRARAPRSLPWRPARPSGPRVRTVTRSAVQVAAPGRAAAWW